MSMPHTEERTCKKCGSRYCRGGVPSEFDPGTCPDCTLHEDSDTQTTAQHTPYSFDGGVDSENMWLINKQGNNGARVERLYRNFPVDPDDLTGFTDEEWQRVIDLIAAAPDLLEACKDALNWMGELADDDPLSGVSGVKRMLSSAIAKAEGR